MEDYICVLRCKGGTNASDLFIYNGPEDCWLNYTLFQGNKACIYGCLGDGNCARVCPKRAIHINNDHLPVIDPNLCDGCGICVKECPRNVLELISRSQLVYLACKSLDIEQEVKGYCRSGCTGCGICRDVCPYGAIRIENNLPIIDYNRCNSCGICVKKCPRNCFVDRARARPYGIISLKCNGCGECVKVCQFNAISGKPNQRHIIDKEVCIGCGRCFEVCPIRAITMAGALGYTKVA
jgi:ferredoxin|uniref:4Fe-4S dicluster domain-containing protein n=1 Tax=candidate division WOR-3 bacterium TaxID=2052148 RepID=A0A7V3RI80_UNCW3